MTLELLNTKLELNVLIEKILYKSGSYKTPLTKEEALKGVQLSETAKTSLKTIKEALEQINQLYDLNVMYGKELQEKEHNIYKLTLENSRLKSKNSMLEQKVNNITKHLEL